MGHQATTSVSISTAGLDRSMWQRAPTMAVKPEQRFASPHIRHAAHQAGHFGFRNIKFLCGQRRQRPYVFNDVNRCHRGHPFFKRSAMFSIFEKGRRHFGGGESQTVVVSPSHWRERLLWPRRRPLLIIFIPGHPVLTPVRSRHAIPFDRVFQTRQTMYQYCPDAQI